GEICDAGELRVGDRAGLKKYQDVAAATAVDLVGAAEIGDRALYVEGVVVGGSGQIVGVARDVKGHKSPVRRKVARLRNGRVLMARAPSRSSEIQWWSALSLPAESVTRAFTRSRNADHPIRLDGGDGAQTPCVSDRQDARSLAAYGGEEM